jgi:hypothetical protein
VGIQRRARRPATRPNCCGFATPSCYQTDSCSNVIWPVQSRELEVPAARQPMALNVHLYNRVAPEERGRTWKSV